MKINWGAGIAILYGGFVIMILILVGASASQKIDLVTDQYYQDELRFQEKINKTNNAKELAKPLTWEVNKGGIEIFFPKEYQDVSGNVYLYCPANNKNDRVFPIKAINEKQLISSVQIPEGRYRLQIDWKNGATAYWNEDVVVINH